jgi:hypothetical protein
MAMSIETHKNHIKSTNKYFFLKICMNNVSALHLRMHTNDIYELITELHAFIQSTLALRPEVVI